MSRVSVKGVVLGGLVDIVATNIVAFPVIIVAALRANAMALPKEQQTPAVMQALQNTTSLFVTQLILGGLCSILGGYIAARVARREALLNGALSSFLCVGFGLYSFITKVDAFGPWAHVGFLVTSPLLGALGGWLWARRRSRAGLSPAAAAAIAALAILGCGDPSGPSPAQGVWEFDATYGGNGYSCTITGATLTLQREPARWTGSMTGGESHCVPPPGESDVPPGPINVALDPVIVQGDSVTFSLAGESFTATGQVSDGQMSGTVEAATPFCQCTEPFLSGTWTATFLEPANTSGRL